MTTSTRRRIVDPQEPAFGIVMAFGGPEKLAELSGKPIQTIRRWMRPKDRHGTGGVIPHWHHADLLDLARQQRVRLRRTDFMPMTAIDRLAS